MRDEGIAKVIALKAYLLVKQAGPQERSGLKAQAERAVRALQGDTRVEVVRRRLFYNLVLAELLLDTDPVPNRAAAFDDGDRLAQLGYADPVPLYMKIVEATTERRTTAHFGDFKSSPCWSHSSWSNSPSTESQVFRTSLEPALSAVQFEGALAERYDRFLLATPMAEIMRGHGIP
jgi:hypothetical protein